MLGGFDTNSLSSAVSGEKRMWRVEIFFGGVRKGDSPEGNKRKKEKRRWRRKN